MDIIVLSEAAEEEEKANDIILNNSNDVSPSDNPGDTDVHS